jgi:AcrR family transcriptional regulator
MAARQMDRAAGPSGKPVRAYQSARRAQTAADTRDTILTVAMRLFTEQGYGRVTVNDIARAAGVAVPTVYASTGGKSAILAALVAEAQAAPVVDETLAAVGQSPTPGDAVRVTASGVRADNEQHRDLLRVMKAAAEFDEAAADIVARSDEVYRQALAQVVDRVQEMGALRPGLSPRQATDILWFYLGPAAWDLLVAGRQWTWDEAEQWLAGQASAAILDLPSAEAPDGGPDGR